MAHLNLPPTIRFLRSITNSWLLWKIICVRAGDLSENEYLYYIYIYIYIYTHTHIYMHTHIHAQRGREREMRNCLTAFGGWEVPVLPSTSWRPRGAGGVTQSESESEGLRARAAADVNPSSRAEDEVRCPAQVVMQKKKGHITPSPTFRSIEASTDWMMSTCIRREAC